MLKTDINDLLQIMERLRDPDGGCPWDIEQTFSSIAPYTIEEAYEVVEAISHNDMPSLADELGDLLLQVVFHAQIAKENDLFTFEDVVKGICEKMLRRHPHVFGDVEIKDAAAQSESWEQLKAKERAEKGLSESALDGVALGLPALTRAVKLQKRAARVGFDWASVGPVFDKIREEISELEEEVKNEGPGERLEEEYGDIMFVMANLARHLKIEPETALRNANAKFERRFKAIEINLGARGETLDGKSLEELDREWAQVKLQEKA